MTTAINRDFCPPSQLRSSSGLAFRQAKQPQRRTPPRPNTARTVDDNHYANLNVSNMEQSQYDNVPSTSDSDVIADRANEQQHQSVNDVQLRVSLPKASDNQSKRRSGVFNSVFSQQSSTEQRSESWVWNQQERTTLPKPGFV